MLNKGCVVILLCFSLFINAANAQTEKTTSFFFDTDVSTLDHQQKDKFSQFVNEIDSTDIISISIFGYCDDRGRKGYNDTLSVARAHHLKALLEESGLAARKIKLIIGNGKVGLTVAKNISAQRTYNRRVDLVVAYNNKNFNSANTLLSDTLKIGDKIILENILFENSRSLLLEESIAVLERITHIIKEKKQYNIAILGHICCNPPGKDVKDLETGEYNLSQARAKLIYDYLIYKGVDKKRLTYNGMMANFPLGKGEKNDRRVELQITGINK